MWQFFKTLFQSLYRQTVGGMVRLVKHTWQAEVDEEDKRYLGRVAMYATFAVLVCFFPAFAMTILALRIMVMGDLFKIFVDMYQDAVNSLKQYLDPAT